MSISGIAYSQGNSGSTAKDDDPKKYRQLLSMLDMSYNYYLHGEYQKSLENNLETIKLAEEVGNIELAQEAYSYLGYDYLILQDTLRALESFKKSNTYANQSKQEGRIADTYIDLATVYVADDRTYAKGVRYFDKAIKIYKNTNDSIGLTNGYYEYAKILSKNKDFGKFSIVIDSLLDYTNQSSDKDVEAKIYNLQSNNLIRIGSSSQAQTIIEKAIAISKDSIATETLEESYRIYATTLAASGDYRRGYEVLKSYDSIFQINQKSRNLMANKRIAAKFQFERMQRELDRSLRKTEQVEEKVQQKTVATYFLLGLILFATAVVAFLYYVTKKRNSFIHKLKIKNLEIKKAKRESERLAKVKSNFFSTVSHELRTPLYGVIGLSNILLEKHKGGADYEELKSLKFSADYLLALVNDVLQINKIDSKEDKEDHAVDFDLKELIQKILLSFNYVIQQNENEVAVSHKGDTLHIIHGNKTALSQILMNLIGNACKFTTNGKITIETISECFDDQCHINFKIKDTGPGIAPEKINHMFEEFAQGESKNITYQGTGLGLSIVKRLIHAAGSDIEVQSELGKGSTFTFDMYYRIGSEITHNVETTSQLAVDQITLLNKNILIVEDNKINQLVTRKILEQNGVHCDIAENGRQAIEKASAKNYDLILMDVHMPVMDGIEATTIIRQSSSVPILALTAAEIDEMREQIYKCGMNDIIVKPYNVDNFKKAIIKGLEINQTRYKA